MQIIVSSNNNILIIVLKIQNECGNFQFVILASGITSIIVWHTFEKRVIILICG